MRAIAIAGAFLALLVAVSTAQADGKSFAQMYRDGYNAAAVKHGWESRIARMTCRNLNVKDIYVCSMSLHFIKGPHAGVNVCIGADFTPQGLYMHLRRQQCLDA